MEDKSQIAEYALRVIQTWVSAGEYYKLNPVPEQLRVKAACFVSIHLKSDGSLRGCIGTLEPRYDTLHDEILHNAISAAQNDSRFLPVRPDELADLHVSVDVLSIPEKTSIEGLDPLKYGVIVELAGFRRAVLLPRISGINTVEEQLRAVKRKANLSMHDNDELTFYRFTTTRYELSD